MAGRRELGFPKTSSCSLREQAARTTLRNVRSKGHPYVELREDGKRFVFFCTLCLSPCYSDSTLFDHLEGHLHTERYATAELTLLRPNPWPFNDGVLFFHESSEQDKRLLAVSGSNHDRFLNTHEENNNLALIGRKTSNTKSDGYEGLYEIDHNKNIYSGGRVFGAHDKNLNDDGGTHNLLIPGVVINDEISSLGVSLTGLGQIAVRICENYEITDRISRIWCAWLGKEILDDGVVVPEYDFAVVTFSYNYNLGRKGLLDDFSPLLSSSPCSEVENVEGCRKKRKQSFSDPEDISESLSEQYGSSGEDCLALSPTSKLPLDRYKDQLQHAGFISSKAIRRELRRQQRLASERMCDVCQHKMLPGKDVATLLNMKTGQLACSSRNVNGAFHVFHTSCLVHWILLCEFEIRTNQLANPKMTHGSKRNGAKQSKMQIDDGKRAARTQISSVFCPECQGTGINIEGDQLEKPTVSLSEMFNYKIKSSDAHRAWMKSPERLQNCSIGLHFPCSPEETVQEKVSPLKLLHFYQADE